MKRSSCALAIVFLCACGGNDAGSGGADGGSATSVGAGGSAERGQYLVDNVLACGQCHTPTGADGKPDPTKYLAGSRSYDFTTDTGEIDSVYAENITSDKDQGVGTWTDKQVRTAIIGGTDDDVNVAMWPIMPYPEYALLTDDDLTSIVKYLRTVPASSNVVAADTLADPYPPAVSILDSQIPQPALASSDADYASALRGRYLAAVGCVNCHTPEISPGNPKFDQAFAGGRTYVSRSDLAPSTSTNLTPATSGLAGWTADDIVTSMKTNTDKSGTPLCQSAPHRMANMTDVDLRDLANYLHALPAIEAGPYTCQ